MSTLTFVVLAVLTFFFGSRFLITILITALVGWLLCDIDVETRYTWYSGIWHGLFFVPNFIRSMIWDTPYKAELYTAAYNIYYWIFSILSTLGFLAGGFDGRRSDYR